MQITSCAITGHRPNKFNFNENSLDLDLYFDDPLTRMENIIYFWILFLCRMGINKFYVGGAIGVDMWSALAILKAKQEYNHIELITVVPFTDQAKYFSEDEKDIYNYLLDSSNEVIILNDKFKKGCYYQRNRFMVDNADMLLAVTDKFSKTKSGTSYTYAYAKSINKPTSFVTPVNKYFNLANKKFNINLNILILSDRVEYFPEILKTFFSEKTSANVLGVAKCLDDVQIFLKKSKVDIFIVIGYLGNKDYYNTIPLVKNNNKNVITILWAIYDSLICNIFKEKDFDVVYDRTYDIHGFMEMLESINLFAK